MRKILYIGLRCPIDRPDASYVHFPVINIAPRAYSSPDIAKAFSLLHSYTHIIFTSQSSVDIFFHYLNQARPNEKLQFIKIISIGKATSRLLTSYGYPPLMTATDETTEGLIDIMKDSDLREAFILWPHSALSRRLLETFFLEKKISYQECVLYDILLHQAAEIPDLSTINEIVFTSPSTVDAFCKIFGAIPWEKTITPLGVVTKTYLAGLKKEYNYGTIF